MVRRNLLIWAAPIAWLSAVGVGFLGLLRVMASPGDPGSSPPAWPAGTKLRAEPGVANLVLLAHPRCPCTRASLAELARIVEASPARVAARVVFYRPERSSRAWAEASGLWNAAQAIPGVRVVDDPGGVEAARFGARTSGQAILFDGSGSVVFRGGITGFRGHEGPNPGSEAVLAWLGSRGTARREADVFGCPLHTPRAGVDRGAAP